MLRYWQAYMSVKDSQYPNPDVRTLTVVQDTVQIRLSALVASLAAFLFIVVTAYAAKYLGVKNKAHKIHLPSSQLDWMVQAAREHAQSKLATRSPSEFAIDNQHNFFISSPHLEPCIVMATDKPELAMRLTDYKSAGVEKNN